LLASLVLSAGLLHAKDRSTAAPPLPPSSLLSVTFDIPNSFGAGGPVPMSGPDPSATAANPLFGRADVWNHLPAPFGVLTANPSWSGLVDSEGRKTRVRFDIRGTVLPVNLYPYAPDLYEGNTLRSQFLAWNSWNGSVPGGAGPGESRVIRWTISGLRPNAIYAMFVYGSLADSSRSFDMRIQGVTKSVPTYPFGSPMGSGGAYFPYLRSDYRGEISGLGIGVGEDSTAVNEANWVGFQLVRVPSR
jgi:hypothetical protein